MSLLKKIKKAVQKTFKSVEDVTGLEGLGSKLVGSPDEKKDTMQSIAAPDPAAAQNAAVEAAQKEAGISELERKRRLRAASLLNNPQSTSPAGTGTLLGG